MIVEDEEEETGVTRKVEWPPREDEAAHHPQTSQDAPVQIQECQYFVQTNNEHQPVASRTFMPLRQEIPLQQKPTGVYSSEPAIKKKVPKWCRGDSKWPPAHTVDNNPVPEPTERPKKQHRDYSQFFSNNAIQNTYPGYRCPPGTQHFLFEDSQTPPAPGETDM